MNNFQKIYDIVVINKFFYVILVNFSKKKRAREVIKWRKKFNEVQFGWIGREGNKVADRLAKQTIPRKW